MWSPVSHYHLMLHYTMKEILTDLLVFMLLFGNAVTQTVTVTRVTANPRLNSDVKLTCTVSVGCCTSEDRIWVKSTGESLLTNQNSVDSSKYVAEYDGGTTNFSLIIKDLQDSDLNIGYKCEYNLGQDTYNLDRDGTFEYNPTEICPFKNNKRDIQGTLNITKSQPEPEIYAFYKDKNWTDSLIIVSPAVNYNTYFWTVTVSLNIDGSLTCGNNEEFTLRVITGTSATNVCNNLDFCKCGECVGKDCGFGILGDAIGTVVILAVLLSKYSVVPLKKKIIVILGTFFGSAVVCVVFGAPIGILVCHCIDGTAPAFILLGVGSSIIIGMVLITKCLCANNIIYGVLGSDVTLPCDFTMSKGQVLEWIHKASDGQDELYAQNGKVNDKLSGEIFERLNLSGANLKISNLMENDGGKYICKVTGTDKKKELQLIVKGEKE